MAVSSSALPSGASTETTLGTRLSESDFDTKTGSLTEASPATDTASSGLNGRLQRIAQRITSLITALGSPFQAGGSIGNTGFIANAGSNLNTSALATEAGNLASIKAKTDNIPAQGQALAAGSTPVVLTAAQLTTLTPPAALTNYATETGGNLAASAASLSVLDDWDETDRAKVNVIAGQVGVQGASGAVSANTQRVVLATDVALPTGANVIGQVTANAGTNLNTSLLALEAGNLAVIAGSTTDTAGFVTPLTVPSAGGYVRQDSTATIAKESGGNLETIAAIDYAVESEGNLEQMRLMTQILTYNSLFQTQIAIRSNTNGFVPVREVPSFLGGF